MFKIMIVTFCFFTTMVSGGKSYGDNNGNTLLNQAGFLYREGEYDKSQSALREIIDKYPDSAAALAARSGIVDCYHRLKDYDRSIEYGSKFLKDYPDNPFAENVELIVARSLLWDKQYDEAANKYKEFIEKHQGSAILAEAYYFLGHCYAGPANWTRDKRELLKQALTCYSIVVNNYPDSSRALSAIRQMGLTYYRLSEYEQGIIYLNEFLSKETKPEGVLGGTLFYLAACYKRLGNIDEAKNYYHRIIKELPNTKWEKNAKKALAKL